MPNQRRKTEVKSSNTIGTMYNQLNKVKSKRNNKKGKPKRTLFDTGSSGCVINRKCVKECQFLKNSKP